MANQIFEKEFTSVHVWAICILNLGIRFTLETFHNLFQTTELV